MAALAHVDWDPAALAALALGFQRSGWTVIARDDRIAVERADGALHARDLVALGAALELLSIAAAARGVDLRIDLAGVDARAIAARDHDGSDAATSNVRLAACVDRMGTLAAARGASTMAPHVRGRLVDAALHHRAELVWLDDSAIIDELGIAAAVEPLRPRTVRPGDVRALAMIRTDAATPPRLVAAGRAAQRVWLEAVSLGVAADPLLPRRSTERASDGGADLVWFALAPAAPLATP